MKLPGRTVVRFVFIIFFIVSFVNPSTVHAQVFSSNSVNQNSFTYASFPSNALVLLADGSEKHISAIQAGDVIAAYDPLAEGYITTSVERVQKCEAQTRSMVSVMLILEDFSVSLHANGGLAGVTLQATAEQKVLTSEGIKAIGHIQEGDELYCYHEISGRFLAFNAYAIQTTTDAV